VERNRILSSLKDEERKWIRPYLTHVALKRQDALCSSLAPITSAYFPTSGMISLIGQLHTGVSAEMASFGNDGVLGVLPCIGIPFAVTDGIVEVSGQGFRLPRAQLIALYLKSDTMRREVHRHITSLLFQANLNNLCNVSHPLEQRVCRLLLRAESLAHTPSLPLTHADIGKLLGAQRCTISLIVKKLDKDGLVSSSRGCIVVRDRERLVRSSCECHGDWADLQSKIRTVR
jgi:CRP-like cAMP-binding protein